MCIDVLNAIGDKPYKYCVTHDHPSYFRIDMGYSDGFILFMTKDLNKNLKTIVHYNTQIEQNIKNIIVLDNIR